VTTTVKVSNVTRKQKSIKVTKVKKVIDREVRTNETLVPPGASHTQDLYDGDKLVIEGIEKTKAPKQD
jgi:hypothetical protein